MVGVLVSSGLGLVFPRIMGTLVDAALQPTLATDTALDGIALLLLGVFSAQGAFGHLRTYFKSAMAKE